MNKTSLIFSAITLSLFASFEAYASNNGAVIMRMDDDEKNSHQRLRYRKLQATSTVSYQPSKEELSEEKFDEGMQNFRKYNYKIAFKLFKKAAKLGNAKASFNLGVMCEFGRGKPKSPEKAVLWYTKSIQGGYEHEDAYNNLARALRKVHPK